MQVATLVLQFNNYYLYNMQNEISSVHTFCGPHNQTAAVELDNFSRILEMEGVTVRRPEVRPGDFDRPVSTPDFESKSQLYAAMPRDILIVVSKFIMHPPADRTYYIGCVYESSRLGIYGSTIILHNQPTLKDSVYTGTDITQLDAR